MAIAVSALISILPGESTTLAAGRTHGAAEVGGQAGAQGLPPGWRLGFG